MNRLTFNLDCKVNSDDGTFEGYASVFGNRDYGGDIVMPGAFTKTLEAKPLNKIKMLLDHDPTKRIGVWKEMREDERGLYVKGEILLDKQIGKETHIDLKAGTLDEMSIGYRVPPRGAEYSKDRRTRTLKELELFEVSLVTFGMNGLAGVTAVKAAESVKTIREFEDFLRDVGGFSHAQSKAIASTGFKGSEPRDEDGTDRIAAIIRRNIEKLS